jgi:glycosyltransferase involved in cell wall biosynthesis
MKVINIMTSNTINSRPDISIIVAARNQEKYVERCLRSLTSQNLEDISCQVVLVNDGSTDRTEEIVRKYFPEVIIIKNKKNLGLPQSLNIGIKSCSSQYVVRVDADDFVDRNFIKFLYVMLSENSEYQAVFCDYYLINKNEKRIKREDSSINPIACGIMFKRDTLIDLGLYDPKFLMREEEELLIRFDNHGFKKIHLPIPLYRYRMHEDNMTKNLSKMKKYKKKIKLKYNL